MKNTKTGKKFILVFKWLLWVLLVQLFLINISAALHAYRFTHYYDSEKVRNVKSSAGKPFLRTWRMMVGRKLPKFPVEYYPTVPCDTIQFTTHNGVKLEGWYMKTDSSKGTVILFHGLNSNKGNVLSETLEFISMGYNTLLLDMRAHGNSGGIVNTLGYNESEEVKIAFDYIRNKGEKNIVLWGMSLGAVIISKAVSDYNITPEKMILEMPFNRLQDHLKARARLAGFPSEPFGFLVTLWLGIEQGFWGFSHKTSSYVKKVNCPVLLQWGAKDAYVTAAETNTIFSNIASEKKQLVIYDQGMHAPLIRSDKGKWELTVGRFLNN